MKPIDPVKREKALALLADTSDSKLRTHLNSCVRCGLCATSCMYYDTFHEAKYIPAVKVDIVASIYKRYNTFLGKHTPKLVNARPLNEETAEEMVDLLFGSCTMCGRCVTHCSIGVDISYLVHKGREMLAEMGMVPASLQSTVDAAVQTGNNMAIPVEEYTDTIEWMEEELQDEVEDENAHIPLDESDRNVFYTLNPREPKFFPLSIKAMAKIFYAAQESWTLSSKYYDVTNYGYFNGNTAEATLIARNLHDEVLRLKGKRLILGECGHGSYANRWEGPNYLGHSYEFDMITAVELIKEYIDSGRIRLDKSLNSEPVTIHDPCNLIRNGGLFKTLRYVLHASCSNIIEMDPYGNDNHCCGGGGGQLAMSEYNERRLGIGKIKADQISKSGARIVITPCHNCVDQLLQLNHTYKLNVKIMTVAEIVANALIL
jgi:Fe-S oxidoreductase